MTPDLKQLRDLVREMRDELSRAHPIVIKWCFYQGDSEALFNKYVRPLRATLARADALIGPGDGFQEVERLNAEAESDAS